MPVIQPKFEVSDETFAEFMSGDINFQGLVAQYAKGSEHGGNVKEWIKLIDQNPNEIVKDVPAVEKANELPAVNTSFYDQYKKEIWTGVGFMALATIIGFGAKKLWDKHKEKKEKEDAEKIVSTEPEELKDFIDALNVYGEALDQRGLSIDIINSLLDKLEKLKKRDYFDEIEIPIPASLLSDLLTYTIELAKANDFELDEQELHNSGNGVIKLQTYLKAQKRVFESAA